MLGKSLLAIQRVRLSTVSATTASWQALSAAHALRSAHASRLMSCNDTNHFNYLNESFRSNALQSIYLFNATSHIQSNTTSKSFSTCGWSSSAFPAEYPHGLSASEINARLSKIVANSTATNNPWVWAPSVIASTSPPQNVLLYYVLPPPDLSFGYVISAVDFSTLMAENHYHLTGPLILKMLQALLRFRSGHNMQTTF